MNELGSTKNDVIVVTEHWLWPYKLDRLSQVHPDFDAECCYDSRLTAESTLTSGCGSVGLLYRKDIKVSPVLNIRSVGLELRAEAPTL